MPLPLARSTLKQWQHISQEKTAYIDQVQEREKGIGFGTKNHPFVLINSFFVEHIYFGAPTKKNPFPKVSK